MAFIDPHKNYLLEVDEQDQTIQTFGDTPTSVKSTPNKVAEVEEEIEEDEEKSNEAEEAAQSEGEEGEEFSEEYSELPDDETLSYLPFSELNKIKFIKQWMLDYATPGGVNTDSGCTHCGKEDVGDVAIIDAEIEESPRDDGPKPVENGSGGEAGGDFGMGEEEEGLGEELMEYEKHHKQLFYPYILGTEGFLINTLGGFMWAAFKDAVSAIYGVVGKIASKVARFGVKVFTAIRNKIMRLTLHAETLQKLWNFKIERQLATIDVERLNTLTVSAFDYNTWIKTTQVAIASYELVKHCDKVIFDSSKEEVTNTLKKLEAMYSSIGIKISIVRNSIKTDDLMDKKQHKTIEELGYTRDKMTSLMRYFKDIASRTKEGSAAQFDKIIAQCVKKIDQESSELNEAYENEELAKSKEYKDKQEKIMNEMVRLDWCFCILKLSYILFDELIDQLLAICDKYERSLDLGRYLTE